MQVINVKFPLVCLFRNSLNKAMCASGRASGQTQRRERAKHFPIVRKMAYTMKNTSLGMQGGGNERPLQKGDRDRLRSSRTRPLARSEGRGLGAEPPISRVCAEKRCGERERSELFKRRQTKGYCTLGKPL